MEKRLGPLADKVKKEICVDVFETLSICGQERILNDLDKVIAYLLQSGNVLDKDNYDAIIKHFKKIRTMLEGIYRIKSQTKLRSF